MKSNQIKPLGDRVLVKPDEPEGKVGKILLPDAFQKKSQYGTVLAVGKDNKEPLIKVGSRVAFAAYGGAKILTEDQGKLELLDNNLVWVVL